MTMRRPQVHSQFGPIAIQIFAANERINQLIIESLAPEAWTLKRPAQPSTQVRTIAAIFTHLHNVRCKWIRLTAPHLKVPAQLNRSHCTPKQAQAALKQSATGCVNMLKETLDAGEPRIDKFLRDGWAQPWPAGPEMLCYMLAHEAHHRGQVCMLAHQLGYALPKQVGAGMWNWEKLWKECGSSRGPGYA